jgi:hypothetical protein
MGEARGAEGVAARGYRELEMYGSLLYRVYVRPILTTYAPTSSPISKSDDGQLRRTARRPGHWRIQQEGPPEIGVLGSGAHYPY